MSDESISAWKHRGILAGTFFAAMLPIVIPAYFDIKGRIDSGKDEVRAHWQAVNASDSADRQYIMRQLDTIIHQKK